VARFGDETASSGFQDAVHFRDSAILFRQDREQPGSENDIEFCINARKIKSVDSSKVAILQPQRGSPLSSPAELAFGTIDSSDRYVREPFCQPARVESRSTAKLYKPYALTWRRLGPKRRNYPLGIIPEEMLPA
jgi:hypothetical protein